MSEFLFQGASALALDAKGRLTVPARHRELLAEKCAGRLTITRHPEGCLMVFPRPVWETFRAQVAALPMSASGWKRIFLGNAMDVEIDGASRVLISPELRAAAGLVRAGVAEQAPARSRAPSAAVEEEDDEDEEDDEEEDDEEDEDME